MVKVKWLGHACFEISGRKVTIVTDPHDGYSIGLNPPRSEADIVLISHDHFDHADGEKYVKKSDAKVLKAEKGVWSIHGVEIMGITSFHDKFQGRQRGKNIVYKFTVDEVSFCHLGDIGHELADEQLKAIGKVHVLFIPVGGTYTIGPREAVNIIEKMNPNIVIPMHYRIPGLKLPIAEVDDFIDVAEDKFEIKYLDGNEIEVDLKNLPEKTTIYILTL
ncbi:MAG TPA: Zn-dependent hydrolase [Candidatus Bathyarchaeota archaeon]|nr:Zn-dependent hydrolase [Candidatus Bathyarchaeota archaeon]